MNSAGKITGLSFLLLFALIFIPPICAQTPSDKAPASGGAVSSDDDDFDDDAFFFEAAGLVFEVSPIIEIRSYDEIFPGLSRTQRLRVRGETGLRYAFEKDGAAMLAPDINSGLDLMSIVMKKKPSHIIEALVVVPYKGRELDLLDVYNALARVKNIKDQKLTINGKEYSIFTDTTRLVSEKERKPIADPEPVDVLPYKETMYIRFIDPYIGDLYLRGDISVGMYGITYSMTNFRDVSYYIFRVMKSDRFSAIIYVEPVKEGILIYSVSGLYLPNFIAKKINLTPNMNRRITVLLNWVMEGLTLQEDRRQDKHFYRLRPKTN